MYKEFFGFKESPFSIAPDPRFLYMSDRHREALAHLVYGVGSDGGFVLLTGEVGAGKTTICRCLLDQAPPDAEIAFILNPKLTALELLATICDEFGIPRVNGNSSIKDYVDRLNAFLLDVHARGRRAILIIDEAQNLQPEVLEQIRLLTNLETDQRKLLQILLLGQPELRDLLERPELRQLAQRITARFHLDPLSRKETAAYVTHRLGVAGIRRSLFPPSLMKSLHRKTGGIPRLINILCDRALLGAYSLGRERVSRSILNRAAREVNGRRRPNHGVNGLRRVFYPLIGAALATFLLGGIALHQRDDVGQAKISIPTLLEPAPAEVQAGTVPGSSIWPDDLDIASSKGESFRALFARWGLSYEGDDSSACDFAEKNGLQCLFRQGNLASLRHFNRPAVLRLVNANGEEFFAALVSIKEKVATFNLGDQTIESSVSALEDLWFGEYIFLWRPPPVYTGTIRPGDTGKVVEWLKGRVAGIPGKAGLLTENSALEGDLLKWIIEFQRSRKLKPDGLVGPHTLIHINTLTDSDVPRLVETMGEK